MSPQTTSNQGRITQQQIADQLGITRQLVSLALRGQGKVAEETRRKVLEIARESNYNQFSNHEARRLAALRNGTQASSGVLAVVFEATFEDQPLSKVPFFVPYFEGLETEAIQQGVDLVLCPLRRGEVPRWLYGNQVDGIVFLAAQDDDLERLSQLGLPLVSILRSAEGVECLLVDNEGGSAEAATHLIELGHRRIAYLSLEKGMSAERRAGFQHALREAGVLDDALFEVEDTTPSIATGVRLMNQLLERFTDLTVSGQLPFSALGCANDLIAIGAIQVLQERGFRVPDDVSVVGFDDISLEHHFSPAISSVGFSRRLIGSRAIQLLCGSTQESLQGCSERFPTKFVPRESTRPFAAKPSQTPIYPVPASTDLLQEQTLCI